MDRVMNIAGAAVLAVMAGLLVYNGAFNPIRAQRTDLVQELHTMEGGWEPDARRSGRPPEELQQIILAQATVWRGLIAPPPPKEKPFDMEGAMRGITPTRRSIGSGADMKVRIETNNNPRGDYYGVGDVVDGGQGIKVKEIGRDYVVFSKEHNGKEYTRRLGR